MTRLQIFLTGILGSTSIQFITWANIGSVLQIVIQLAIGFVTLYSLIKNLRKNNFRRKKRL